MSGATFARLDARHTLYRFDLEADVPWDALGAPGRYFPDTLLTLLGWRPEATAAHPEADALLQWGLAFETARAFGALERDLVEFVRGEGAALPATRSAELLVEEEEKHLRLFERWEAWLRARRPREAEWLERAEEGGGPDGARRLGLTRLRAHADAYGGRDAVHYTFWLNTLFFEEYTVWLAEALERGDAAGGAAPGPRERVQPAWLETHRAHRREEIQHVATDVGYLGLLALDPRARHALSTSFLAALAEGFGDAFAGAAAGRLVEARFPEVGPLGGRPFEALPFWSELLRHRAFRETRRAAPSLALRASGEAAGPPAADAAATRAGDGRRGDDGEALDARLVAAVRGAWSEALGLDAVAIDLDASFVALGGTSLRGSEAHAALERRLGRALAPALLAEGTSVRAAVRWLTRAGVGAADGADGRDGRDGRDVAPGRTPRDAAAVADARADAATALGDDAIVLTALALRLPGASTPDAFWAATRAGVSALEPRARGTGGFIDERLYTDLDAEAFGLNDAEAAALEPQQRLFLGVALEALEAAPLPGPRVGVFAASGDNEYALRWVEHDALVGPDSLLGALRNMVAARVSGTFALGGPSLTVDAACASSLVGLHLARRSLQAGECDAALVGAAQVNLTGQVWLYFERSGLLSRTGRARPFDAAGDGLVPGEGAVAFVLMRAGDARAVGAPVRAVLRASAMNNDGGGGSRTAPRPSAQRAVIDAAWREARVAERGLGYVEAHAAGTPLGDALELTVLAEAHAATSPGAPPLPVGSAKGAVGHTLAVAGGVGLARALLALEHGELPPTVGYETRTPRADAPEGRVHVPREVEPWRGPRRAGVSAFGLGGTNVHVVLERVAREPRTDAAATEPAAAPAPQLVTWAAPDALLERRAQADGAWVAAHADAPLEALCAALRARPALFRARRAAVVSTHAELQAALLGTDPRPRARRERVCFVLPGPGSQVPGLGRALYTREPAFRAALDACASAFAAHGVTLLERMFADDLEVHRIEHAQPAVFSLGVALARWLGTLGVHPDLVLGHSAGELAAAHLAGSLSLADAATLVALRGRAMAAAEPGRMAAVLAPLHAVERAVPFVSIAAENAPGQVVIAGGLDAMDAAEATLRALGHAVQPLDVGCAAHTPLVADAARALADAAGRMRLAPPDRAWLSTATAARVEALDAAHFSAQLSRRVRFVETVRAAHAAGADLFVELGATAGLSACIDATLTDAVADGRVQLVPLGRRDDRSERPALEALAALFEAGLPLRPSALGGARVALLRAPALPLAPRRHWIEAPANPEAPHPRAEDGTESVVLSWDSAALVRAHRTAGEATAPAALLVDLALEGLDRALVDALVPAPLALRPGETRRVSVRTLPDGVRVVRDGATEHFRARQVPAGGRTFARLDLAALERRCTRVLEPRALFAELAAGGMELGPALQGLVRVAVEPSGDLLVAELVRPAGSPRGRWLDPALLDGAAQAVSAFFAERGLSERALFLGFAFSRLSVHAPVHDHARALVRLRTALSVGVELVRFDLVLADADGEVRAEVEDFAVKRRLLAPAASEPAAAPVERATSPRATPAGAPPVEATARTDAGPAAEATSPGALPFAPGAPGAPVAPPPAAAPGPDAATPRPHAPSSAPPPDPRDPGPLLRRLVAARTGRDAATLPAHEPLYRLGIDSLSAVAIAREVEAALGLRLPVTILLEHPTLAGLEARLRRMLEGPR